MRQRPVGRSVGAMRAAAALALAAMVAMPAGLWAAGNAPTDPRVAATLTRLTREGDTQTAFITPPPPEPPAPPPEWLKSLLEWLSGDGGRVVTWLGWGFVALIVLFALYLTVPWLRDLTDNIIARVRRKDSLPHGDTIEWQPDQAGALNLLAEADRLAAAGQFGEAVHLLLGRSLEDIASRRPGLLKPALTARAIAVMAELPDQARLAFGRIAATVERSLWARQPIDQSAWHDARSAYEDFALGPHWRGQPMAATA